MTGTHTGLNTNDQVAKLYIQEMHSECAPQLVHTFFRNLKVLLVRKSFMSELHADDLHGLTNLEFLDLSENRIQSVPADFFNPTPYLVQVTFASNKIKYFEARILPQLVRITYFNMSSNICVNLHASTSRLMRELHALIKTQCAPEAQPVINYITNTIDNTCTNSTCTNIIYSYGDNGQGNDTIIETY